MAAVGSGPPAVVPGSELARPEVARAKLRRRRSPGGDRPEPVQGLAPRAARGPAAERVAG
jgi:hypothetical protein